MKEHLCSASPDNPGFCFLSFTMRHMQSDQDNSRSEHGFPDSNRKLKSGNLILVGMMGSGKTTVGKMLARQLERFLWIATRKSSSAPV